MYKKDALKPDCSFPKHKYTVDIFTAQSNWSKGISKKRLLFQNQAVNACTNTESGEC